MSVGVVLLLPHPVDSRLRGNDGPGKVGVGLFTLRPSGLRIKSAMTGCPRTCCCGGVYLGC